MEISFYTKVTAIWKEAHPQVSEFLGFCIPDLCKYSSKLTTFIHNAVICILIYFIPFVRVISLHRLFNLLHKQAEVF